MSDLLKEAIDLRDKHKNSEESPIGIYSFMWEKYDWLLEEVEMLRRANAVFLDAYSEEKIKELQKHVDDWIKHQQFCPNFDMVADQEERDVDQETPCPGREDKIHCVCWWEGEACCGCGDGPSTQRKEKYLICDKCLCVVENHKGLRVFHSC